MSELLAWLSDLPRKVQFHSQPAAEPEPLRSQARPMTGFLATLSAEQREKALAYCGPDTHGEARH
ncbi:hypothetical protein D3C72_1777850 [compost metagenome]